MAKQYKILHVVSGNYCLLFPLTNDRYGIDFENTLREWGGIKYTISKTQWDCLWENNQLGTYEIVKMPWPDNWMTEDNKSQSLICKNEFELVDT